MSTKSKDELKKFLQYRTIINFMNLCHPLTWLKKVNNSQKIEYSCRENRSSKVIYDSHYRSHPRDDTLNCGNFSKNDEASFGPRQPFVTETVMPQTSSRMIVNTNEAVCDSVDNLANDIFLDALDDDELLQSIDVDQIVMEHYQVTGTPEGSVSK
ncbi:uncharacterized protein LOC122012329 [Zingiber officinale]|uniref:uncharacterized protein LOC122012329 n=1 Tax=Zingiber officinale TaxID=94328 RepID=UPI001C4D4300|nr:uncharacterized protein LOC122012329 [Zingiber officinale]